MKKARILLFVLTVFCLSILPAFAQTSNIVKSDLSQAEIDNIVKKFTVNEAAFRQSLTSYAFSRSVSVQTLGMGGQITGNLRRDSFMAITPDGKRLEKINFAPMSTLPHGFMTAEDFEDMGGVNPFALEPSVANLYNFTYLGKEKIDELSLHVFEVSPKVMPDPKKSKQRLFTGRIWVDDVDFVIVKSRGKAVPETKTNKFPVVETWRENVDGKYWFPSLASSDDELVWDDGSSVKLKMRIKFVDYKVGTSEVKILDDDEPVQEVKPKPSPTPKKP
ncbi:MAG: hypothetical protein H0X15_14870 [Acidobacteria bacterium]|nr:hypothetical protein [Acidobacteriota bacterium]